MPLNKRLQCYLCIIVIDGILAMQSSVHILPPVTPMQFHSRISNPLNCNQLWAQGSFCNSQSILPTPHNKLSRGKESIASVIEIEHLSKQNLITHFEIGQGTSLIALCFCKFPGVLSVKNSGQSLYLTPKPRVSSTDPPNAHPLLIEKGGGRDLLEHLVPAGLFPTISFIVFCFISL